MKEISMVKDETLYIPSSISDRFQWNDGAELEIEFHEAPVKSIVIRQAIAQCALCHSKESLTKVGDGHVCSACKQAISGT